jgi:aryl carrier-like protein
MALPKISSDPTRAPNESNPLAERAGTIEQLRRELAELLEEGDAASIASDESLFDRGLDSIRLMMLVERFQQRGAPVSFGDLAEQPTLLAWATLLDAHSQVR